jgi:hypothetical protein
VPPVSSTAEPGRKLGKLLRRFGDGGNPEPAKCIGLLLGHSAEQSIRNLSQITLEGMFPVDPTLLTILQEKIARNENA